MKKTRKELSTPRAAVNYKKRVNTEPAFKRKVFKGFAGVRNFSDTTTTTTENVEAEINVSHETVETETVVKTDNPPTETLVVSNDLIEVVEAEETVENTTVETASGINETIESATFVPTMDNTKKEIAAHATTLGIDVKSWWGKQKILDAIQN